MPPDLADNTAPLPVVPSDSGYPTAVLLAPVFVNDGARRRRLIGRGRFLAAAASVAYLAMLGVSVTALPVIKPGAARPASTVIAPTTEAPPPAQAAPRPAAPVPGPAPKARIDQDAPLVLRLAAPVTPKPVTPRPTPARLTTTTRAHHHDDDKPPSVAPSAAASPTTTKKRSAK